MKKNDVAMKKNFALIDEHEAARMLGLSVKTLRRWRWAGRPPHFFKIGSAVRYDPEALLDFIEMWRSAGPPPAACV